MATRKKKDAAAKPVKVSKAAALREKDVAGLQTEIKDLQKAHFGLRMQKATQQLTNLSTLRELALRAVADEVGEKAASHRQREGLEPALIPERVMVCMSSSADAPRVIRIGSRIAGRLGARWYAVYVETPREAPGRITYGDRDALQRNISLAESLGATVVRVKADRPADGLITQLIQ